LNLALGIEKREIIDITWSAPASAGDSRHADGSASTPRRCRRKPIRFVARQGARATSRDDAVLEKSQGRGASGTWPVLLDFQLRHERTEARLTPSTRKPELQIGKHARIEPSARRRLREGESALGQAITGPPKAARPAP
jgi:hypothetical protein